MGEDLKSFEKRKKEHLEVALSVEAQSPISREKDGLKTRLQHNPLPELNFEEVSLECMSFGKTLKTPFYVSSMTAGHSESYSLNKLFVECCAERGWGFALGSQRRELLDPNSLKEWRELKKESPTVSIYGNLGLAQLIETPVSQIQDLMGESEMEGFFIHLNSLQEVIQEEGTPQFKGGLNALARLSESIDIPLIVKETGCGFSMNSLKKLNEVNVKAVDIAGRGGTHWGLVEGLRAKETPESWRYQVAEVFSDWGVSTQEALEEARSEKWNFELWASGGIKNGRQAAHMLALDAKRVGFAHAALKVALKGKESLLQWMMVKEYELKVSLFCTGSLNVEDLKKSLVEW